ncbi:unnamed protein product [Pleuronectes platessa]|uniref:Uncharacterized protein n=1 Tax=Pleuronectes platessa TaxID=8262 RepID=A0A9N7VHH8_PLEPL|nr:unnamed protein product [Pleuronectes platessa]
MEKMEMMVRGRRGGMMVMRAMMKMLKMLLTPVDPTVTPPDPALCQFNRPPRLGENHGTRERPSVCQWLTAGWQRQAGGVAEAWFMRSVGSGAGVPALNLALPQTSLPWRSTVPTPHRSRVVTAEGRLRAVPSFRSDSADLPENPWNSMTSLFELAFILLWLIVPTAPELRIQPGIPCSALPSDSADFLRTSYSPADNPGALTRTFAFKHAPPPETVRGISACLKGA